MNSAPAADSLWRHIDFRRYWLGQAANVCGSSLSSVAVPLVAVVTLHATTWEAGVLATVQKLPPLLFSLHAGAWCDRRRKRPLMVATDIVSGLAMATVPAAAALGTLTLLHLYAVAFVVGSSQVIGSAASLSYIPVLLRRDQLMQGNAKLAGANTLADIGGPALAGILIGFMGAARAVALDALTFFLSAVWTLRIRAAEPDPAARKPGSSLRSEIREGLAYTWRHPVIGPLVTTNAITSFVLAGTSAIWVVFLVHELRWPPQVFALVMSVGATGGFIASLMARRLAKAFGPGPVMIGALGLAPVSQLPLLLAGPGRAGYVVIGAGLFVQLFGAVTHGLTQRTVRQEACIPEMQGRMQATGQFTAFGLRPVATLLAGASGTVLGLRPTLAIGTVLLILPALRLAGTPVRSLRTLTHNAPA
ncbi:MULTISPECIES: MFS transporter [unclassified Streptomyces]|uniref:MFS transporter n=1 Tax=unclassified Streptomyces TaxID=2593676 RepID=UPI002ED3AE02|nr:MFS transporter [Streptomyces sp. BE230]